MAGPAADLVLAVHFGFILFVVFGAALLVRWPGLVWLHGPALAWGLWIELSGSICPLTPIENDLRAAAGQQGYAGGFIENYLLPVIYPAGLTRATQVGLAIALVAVNLLFYGRFLRARRR